MGNLNLNEGIQEDVMMKKSFKCVLESRELCSASMLYKRGRDTGQLNFAPAIPVKGCYDPQPFLR